MASASWSTLIAFTGTPISFADRNTREVFGDYIDIYDLTRAVEDGATVPVYFQPRLIKVGLAQDVTEDQLDSAADEVTAGLDDAERTASSRASPSSMSCMAHPLASPRWPRTWSPTGRSAANAWARSCRPREGDDRLRHPRNLREPLLRDHRAAPRRAAPRRDWHSPDLDKGRIKVVYSGTPSDVPPVSSHVRRDSANATIKARLKDVDDELEIVIVKDMVLTGYDSPPLHTPHLDRPLKGALLMQTLARVNRTFRGKQDDLLVAYAPLADNLQKALAEYTESDQEHRPVGRPVGRNVDEAVALTTGLVSSIRDLLLGHDWRAVIKAGGPHGFLKGVTSQGGYPSPSCGYAKPVFRAGRCLSRPPRAA